MKQRVASVFIAVFHAFLHVIIMIIIMNMNFYVIFAIVVGASLGYLATSEDYCAKKADHKCCGLKSNFNKGYCSLINLENLSKSKPKDHDFSHHFINPSILILFLYFQTMISFSLISSKLILTLELQ